MTEIITQIANLGPAAAAVVVVIYFLRHIRAESEAQRIHLVEQGQLNRETFGAIIDRVETMEENSRVAYEKTADRIEVLVKSVRSEERHDHEQLLDLTKDYSKHTNAVDDKLSKLEERMNSKKRPPNASV